MVAWVRRNLGGHTYFEGGYLKTATVGDIFGSRLPLPAPHALLQIYCTAHAIDAQSTIYGVANGGLCAEIDFLSLAF
jgi:hypothetical protein